MTPSPDSLIRIFRCTSLGVILLSQTAISMAQAPIIQPEASGDAARALSAEEPIEIADSASILTTSTRLPLQMLQPPVAGACAHQIASRSPFRELPLSPESRRPAHRGRPSAIL